MLLFDERVWLWLPGQWPALSAKFSRTFTEEEEAKEVKDMARAGRAETGGPCQQVGQAQNRALGLRHGRRSEHRIGRCEPRERARSDVNLWSGK